MKILDNGTPVKEPDRVPERHPYGSITDGDWVCGRCGETITGCMICAGEIRHVVRAKPLFNRS